MSLGSKFGILGVMAVMSFTSPLVKKEQLTSDAWKFYFEKPFGSAQGKPVGFRYTAGQYIKIKLPLEHPDNRGNSRYFTLSSSPTEEYLMITTRILKSTFKLELGSLKIGTKVNFRGPWGDFVLDEIDKRERVLIAGGIGLTPYRSMMRYATDMRFDNKIRMFVSYKSEEEILFKDEFRQIIKDNSNIKIITTISEPGKTWTGEKGRINTELLQKHLESLENNVYYIAGPDPMVESLERLLKGEGIAEDNILTDGFPGYK